MNSVRTRRTIFTFVLLWCGISPTYAASLAISDSPLFATTSEPPLTMLVMGRDHKLYYEAYNDASDLNGDAIIDVGYQGYHGDSPLNVDYYGYFNSYVCYSYNGSTTNIENGQPEASARFVPSSAKTAAQIAAKDKTCNGANEWSGDFLNYVTTARIDALRKVFYGGFRATDSTSLTVLERTHIPQDAHAWGKEYDPTRDQYDIADYTPLSKPAPGQYHLFANVSLVNPDPSYLSMDAAASPRMRVLNDTDFRVWDWLSKERPVAGNECSNRRAACERTTASAWSLAPTSMFNNLTRTFYNLSDYDNHVNDAAEFDALEQAYASSIYGSDTVANIDGGPGHPFGSNDRNDNRYMTIIEGQMVIASGGSYSFAVNGDDAVDFSILDGPNWDVVASWYGGHGANSSESSLNSHSGVRILTAGTYTVRFRHHELGGGDSYQLYFGNPRPASIIKDYAVRVEACNGVDATVPNDANSCQRYPSGNYKPVGLLHEFGEDERMMFGLLSGSYEKNLDGGVLRKAVSSFVDEVEPFDGRFTNLEGIVHTIDAFRTKGFRQGSYRYDCGWITNRPIRGGECDMWGNPVAEMMYESLRYFAGKAAPTPAYDTSGIENNGIGDNFPKAAWSDPYDANTGYNQCAAPFQVVVTDINPSYDSDKVPGVHSSFNPSFAGDTPGLHVEYLADTISAGEGNINGNRFFIGQSGNNYDTAPTSKVVDSLSAVRGMAPEEPTKLGSYYSASLAFYGRINDINPREGEQNLQTFSVALASPLPTIEIDVDQNMLTDNSIVLVPFAKSAYNRGPNGFYATNQIVDFYVESLGPTTGSFLVNFEDVEQGADHDMDAISRYTYEIDTVNQEVTIKVDSIYAAGGINQRMGYVISGTNHDGVYLEVYDQHGSDFVWHLDTPSNVWAGEPRGTQKLGLTASRTFKPSGAGSAGFLKDPLWYAAKWGGFLEDDENANLRPDLQQEWDEDGDGEPDNYFLVTNALTLKENMEKAFNEVLSRSGSASSVAANSGSLNENSIVYQAMFSAGQWEGEVRALDFSNGVLGAELWEASEKLAEQLAPTNGFNINREVISINDAGRGIAFKFPLDYTNPGNDEMSSAQANQLLSGTGAVPDPGALGHDFVNYLRGDDANEGVGRNFRRRASPLGDVVHSSPIYVIQPGFFYLDMWPTQLNGVAALAPENAATQKYSNYRTLLKDRTHMLYFGANDGALHAVNAYKNDGALTDGGKEVLAYVPKTIYQKLPELAKRNYRHEYYVDGKVTFADVFFSQSNRANNQWHTVLVGALRGGGQGIYALDISDPEGIASSEGYVSFDEANAEHIALWEFNDQNDADLGYTFGRPTIARLANGRWAAIFGNGYDNTEPDGRMSTTGNAVIYVVDIESGALIKKFDTEVGSSADPLGQQRPNGMSEPAVVDANGDNIADFVFAGDLFGNLWKLDLSDVNDNNWGFAKFNGSAPAPIFVAVAADGTTRLPITQQPKVGAHPTFGYGGHFLVMFGTGKYFESDDTEASNQTTQSIFGVWDDGQNNFVRSDLATQAISQYTVSVPINDGSGNVVDTDIDVRALSQNPVYWRDQLDVSGSLIASKHGGWVLDLIPSNVSPLSNRGERSVSNMLLRDGLLTVSTLIPANDACDPGGEGWVFTMDAATGGADNEGSVVDIDNDGEIDESDLADTDGDGIAETKVAGTKVKGGFSETANILAGINQDGPDTIIVGSSDGSVNSYSIRANKVIGKRLNWRELK